MPLTSGVDTCRDCRCLLSTQPNLLEPSFWQRTSQSSEGRPEAMVPDPSPSIKFSSWLSLNQSVSWPGFVVPEPSLVFHPLKGTLDCLLTRHTQPLNASVVALLQEMSELGTIHGMAYQCQTLPFASNNPELPFNISEPHLTQPPNLSDVARLQEMSGSKRSTP